MQFKARTQATASTSTPPAPRAERSLVAVQIEGEVRVVALSPEGDTYRRLLRTLVTTVARLDHRSIVVINFLGRFFLFYLL
mgnify:CR=1